MNEPNKYNAHIRIDWKRCIILFLYHECNRHQSRQYRLWKVFLPSSTTPSRHIHSHTSFSREPFPHYIYMYWIMGLNRFWIINLSDFTIDYILLFVIGKIQSNGFTHWLHSTPTRIQMEGGKGNVVKTTEFPIQLTIQIFWMFEWNWLVRWWCYVMVMADTQCSWCS